MQVVQGAVSAVAHAKFRLSWDCSESLRFVIFCGLGAGQIGFRAAFEVQWHVAPSDIA